MVLEVDREEHDQRAPENQPRDEQRPRPVIPPGQPAHRVIASSMTGRALPVPQAAGTVPTIGTRARGHPELIRTACRPDRPGRGEIPGREGPSPNRPADCPEPSQRRQVSLERGRFDRARATGGAGAPPLVAPSRSLRSAEFSPTSSARIDDRPPAPASSRRAAPTTPVRPAPRRPSGTTPPPGGNRELTSNTRSRYPPCTPTYRVGPANPFQAV